MKNAFWLSALPLSVAVHAAMAGTNLIADGGFEAGALGWTGAKSVLALDPTAAYTGQTGMTIASNYGWCPYDAVYTLDTADLRNGTLYEFGARVRLAPGGAESANIRMGLIRNGASPLWLDGDQSSYDGGLYPDRWTRLFGVYTPNFAPGDRIQVCISGAAGQTVQVDDVFVTPLTTAEIGYQPPATLDEDTLIRASGDRLVMGTQGVPLVLKGVNVYQYNNGYDPGEGTSRENFGYKNADESSYKEIRELGFNTVRLMLSYLLFEEDGAPGVYKDEGFAVVDRHILWAKKHGIRLVLDMHEPPGGYQSASGFHGFDGRPDLKKRLEDLWVAIAQRYRNETTVVAYDLINEPYVNNWFQYAQTLIDKIRAVDPNHLIDVELSFHPKDVGMYRLADDNLLYDIHYYGGWAWGGSHTNNAPYTGDLESFKRTLQQEEGLVNFYDAAADRFTVPFNVGEYGLVFEKYELEGVNGLQWLADANGAFDHYGISRQMFHYNERNFGIYRRWNSYPGEHTVTTEPLKAALPGINGVQAPPPPPPPPPVTHTDLAVNLTHAPASVLVGEPVTYTLTVHNLGTGATDARAVTPLLSGMQLDAADAGCEAAAGQVTCRRAALGAGASASWNVRVRFAQAGTWQTSARVVSETLADGNAANDQAIDTLTVTAPATVTADMALTTFKATSTPKVGRALGFNFVIKNLGPATAANARFVLPLPPNSAWVSGASECVPSASEVVCHFGDLAKGASRNRYVYLRPAEPGALTATGRAASDAADPDAANDAKSVNLTVR